MGRQEAGVNEQLKMPHNRTQWVTRWAFIPLSDKGHLPGVWVAVCVGTVFGTW